MRRMVIATLIGLSVSAGVIAAEPNDPVSAAMESLTRGLVHEQDVGLVFGYLREAISAAVEGREAPAPERLIQRGEAIAEEMKRRGAVAGHAMLDAIEQSIRESLRQAPRPAPPRPLQRI